jgi:DNA-binding response OmpR family regulator
MRNAAGGRNATVLVVDDEAAVRRLLNRVLANAGYIVVVASDGDEAILAFDRGGIDIVITDLDMPKQGGVSAIDRLRVKSETLPIIAMSGGRELDEAMTAGANMRISKPFSTADMVAAVDVLLSENEETQVTVA